MSSKRLLLPAALLVTLAGAAGWAAWGNRQETRSERAQSEAYARRLGDALIRQGISLYQRGEYQGAIASWERYIRLAPPNADTLSIREMIGEALEASAQKAQGAPRARVSSFLQRFQTVLAVPC
jgi:tetratricopeptide (TPR) repeat protein